MDPALEASPTKKKIDDWIRVLRIISMWAFGSVCRV